MKMSSLLSKVSKAHPHNSHRRHKRISLADLGVSRGSLYYANLEKNNPVSSKLSGVAKAMIHRAGAAHLKIEKHRDQMVATAAAVMAGLVMIASTLVANMPEHDNAAPKAVHFADGKLSYSFLPELDAGIESSLLSARKSISEQIHQKWKIDKDEARHIVNISFEASHAHDVDPLLVLSIIGKESSFRKDAVSAVGAEGLMQVWRKWHEEKFEGMGLAHVENISPRDNVMIGAQVLREYLDKENDDVVKALQRYNGARGDTSVKYAKGVLKNYIELSRAFDADIPDEIYRLVQDGRHGDMQNVSFVENKGVSRIMKL